VAPNEDTVRPDGKDVLGRSPGRGRDADTSVATGCPFNEELEASALIPVDVRQVWLALDLAVALRHHGSNLDCTATLDGRDVGDPVAADPLMEIV
jgi:hypothetical protein